MKLKVAIHKAEEGGGLGRGAFHTWLCYPGRYMGEVITKYL